MTSRTASSSAPLRCQAFGSTSTCEATQLHPLLWSFIVEMFSAWKRMSASLHGPGTTMHGPTPPSSLVMGLASERLTQPLTLRTFRAGAEDDGVVGPRAARDVDRVHHVVAGEVRARRRRLLPRSA